MITLSSFKYFLLYLKSGLKGRIKILSKPTIWFTDNWSNGYFHWMLDALPRLYIALLKHPNANIMLPYQFSNQEYIVSTLNTMGFNPVMFMHKGLLYFFRRLIFQSHLAPTGNYHDETVRNMRNAILNKLPKISKDKGERIYISRAKANRRIILNEKELIPILKQYGFSIIYFEDYNWQQQVAICKHAKIMLGLHGAGLANMLFMPLGSKVIELRKKNVNIQPL